MYLTEFKVMVRKILTGLERRVDELTENFKKETQDIKKNQPEQIRECRMNQRFGRYSS